MSQKIEKRNLLKNFLIIGLFCIIVILLLIISLPTFAQYDTNLLGFWGAGNDINFASYDFNTDGTFLLKVKQNGNIDIFTGKWETENSILTLHFKDKNKINFNYNIYKRNEFYYLDLIIKDQSTTFMKLL